MTPTPPVPSPSGVQGERRATPEQIAAAWRAFRGDRRGNLLGPGAAFVEAINAAVDTAAAARAMAARIRELEDALEPFCFWGYAGFDGDDECMTDALLCDTDVQAARAVGTDRGHQKSMAAAALASEERARLGKTENPPA